MSRQRLPAAVVLTAAIIAVPVPAQSVPELIGVWEGSAAVRSPSVTQGLPVRLTILADGSVTGTVGEATLRNARIDRNRTLPARLFGLGTTWVLHGDLEGSMVSRDGLARENVRMALDLHDDLLAGDLNATGGGRLISVRLRLVHVRRVIE